jgi:DNA-binding NarL/FixJ family response regulator
VLVVSSAFTAHPLAALRAIGVEGVFDAAAEPPARFSLALHDVLAGRRHWSGVLTAQLNAAASPASDSCRLLTACEQIALSVLGDGCGDAEAAAALNLSPATICTIRRHLHRKLGLQHRGDLIRVAAQSGYVQFTPAGVVRPGFARLFAAYQARRRRQAGGESRAAKTRLPQLGLRAA